MNLPDRIKLAWAIATGGKAAASLIPTWQDGAPTYIEASFENLVKHGWRKNELIYACIDKTAKTASFVNLQVTRRRDGEKLDDHPLRRLIQHPNPFMDEFDFWNAVVVYQKLAGAAYFEKERDRAGRVVALWPLRPDYVRPVKSARFFLAGYEYTVPGEPPVPLRAEDVIDFKLFDPLNLYRGYPPAAVAGRVGDVDNATTDYLKLFMEKGGQPPGLLKTKQKLIDQDINDIRRRWGERYGGYQHWSEPAVLDSDAEFQKIGFSFQEMGFEVLDARSEARICMVMGVPPILVGAKIGLDRATYSNYGEARLAWWEDTLIPQYRNFESVIANDLAPDFGDDIGVAFNFSDVPALKESEDAKWTRTAQALGGGYITVNEARVFIGLEDIGEPGDIFLRPNSAAETGLDGERVHEPVAMEPVTADTDDTEDVEPDDDLTEEAARYLDMEAKARRRAPNDKERRAFEKRLRKGLEAYFTGQLDRIETTVGEQYAPVSVNGNGTAD